MFLGRLLARRSRTAHHGCVTVRLTAAVAQFVPRFSSREDAARQKDCFHMVRSTQLAPRCPSLGVAMHGHRMPACLLAAFRCMVSTLTHGRPLTASACPPVPSRALPCAFTSCRTVMLSSSSRCQSDLRMDSFCTPGMSRERMYISPHELPQHCLACMVHHDSDLCPRLQAATARCTPGTCARGGAGTARWTRAP